MSGNNPSYVAGGNISPSRFVMMDTSANSQVLQSTVGSLSVGISHEGTLQAPLPSVTGYAGTAGGPVMVYGLGDTCSVVLGSGGCTSGHYLTSDSSGQAVIATGSNAYYALSKGTAAAGALVRVQVVIGKLLAT